MAKESGAGNGKKNENNALKAENAELRDKVRELEETLDAIRSGEVDAIVVENGDDQKVFTLEGADHPYRALVENIREGALTLSRTGTILYTNSRFADMTKLPADKVAGTPLLDFVCPEYYSQMELALKEILKKPIRSRVRIRQGKGSLPVYISMNPLTPDENTKISVVVTDRRKDEERLQMQARMLNAVGDAVIASDMHNKIIYWNDAATKTYGWTPEEAIGRDRFEVATPKIPHKAVSEIAVRLKKGEIWTGEYFVKHRDGHEFPIYASDAPIFDDVGKVIAIIGASHDISDRKQAERELAERNENLKVLHEQLTEAHEDLLETNTELKAANESLRTTEDELLHANSELVDEQLALTLERDRVRNLLDIAGVMILTLDTTGKVTLINPRGCEILRRPAKEVLGRDWVRNFLPVRLQKSMRAIITGALSGEIEDFGQYENPVRTRDDQERHILWSNTLLKDPDGRITGILSSGEDITERKTAEEALRESEEKFRSVLENSRDVIYRINVETGQYEYVSPSAGEVVGFSPDELMALVSETSLSLIHPEDLPAMQEALANLEKSGGEEVEYRQQTKKGDYRWLSNHMALIRDENGRTLYRSGNIRDVTRRKVAEDELHKKHDELNTAYKELTATQEEVRQTNEELVANKHHLEMKNENLNVLNEEITATQEELRQTVDELTSREKQLSEALAEKEILLAEIHHRVKNNLTAFISLLSLEGSYDDTPTGLALKKDLQNRARSMALIHDTLYRTHKFAEVDMKVYLSTLVEQIVNSYPTPTTLSTCIDVKDISLDLNRATPCGLIINELVTNSLKYAFPPKGNTGNADQQDPGIIGIRMTKDEGTYILKVFDNGIGLPAEYNPRTAKTLGLKLVNFLAKHQMRAKIEVNAVKGTEYVFRFRDRDKGA